MLIRTGGSVLNNIFFFFELDSSLIVDDRLLAVQFLDRVLLLFVIKCALFLYLTLNLHYNAYNSRLDTT